MCYNCFCFKNPEHKLVRNHKTKENQIMSDLIKTFSDLNIIRDKIIAGGCSKRRPDGLIKLNDSNIIIEIDENQHNNESYSCDNKRTMSLFEDLGNSSLTIIRFNPDKYKTKENKIVKSLFSCTKSTGQLKIVSQNNYNKRFNILVDTIKSQLNIIPDKELNIIKLFYNE